MERVKHDLSDAQWTALKEAWGGCAYCGSSEAASQRDCVLPISRRGRYAIDNIVPVCRSCNASKCHHEVTVWMRRRRLGERASGWIDRRPAKASGAFAEGGITGGWIVFCRCGVGHLGGGRGGQNCDRHNQGESDQADRHPESEVIAAD